MAEYPMFQEIVNEISARPDADPVGILEEYLGPFVDICNEVNQWFGENPDFDLHFEPPWYSKFLDRLARFDVDLTPIWQEQRNLTNTLHGSAQAGQPTQD